MVVWVLWLLAPGALVHMFSWVSIRSRTGKYPLSGVYILAVRRACEIVTMPWKCVPPTVDQQHEISQAGCCVLLSVYVYVGWWIADCDPTAGTSYLLTLLYSLRQVCVRLFTYRSEFHRLTGWLQCRPISWDDACEARVEGWARYSCPQCDWRWGTAANEDTLRFQTLKPGKPHRHLYVFA